MRGYVRMVGKAKAVLAEGVGFHGIPHDSESFLGLCKLAGVLYFMEQNEVPSFAKYPYWHSAELYLTGMAALPRTGIPTVGGNSPAPC